MDTSIVSLIALVVGSLSLIVSAAFNVRREERIAVNTFAQNAYQFCSNVAKWYTRVTDLTLLVVTSGKAGTLDKAKIDEYKTQILKVMSDDVYWTPIHMSLADLKSSLPKISQVSAEWAVSKVDEISYKFHRFKEFMLEHKKGIYHLLERWDGMDEEAKAVLLNDLQEEKKMIEGGKDELVRLVERTKELHT